MYHYSLNLSYTNTIHYYHYMYINSNGGSKAQLVITAFNSLDSKDKARLRLAGEVNRDRLSKGGHGGGGGLMALMKGCV